MKPAGPISHVGNILYVTPQIILNSSSTQNTIWQILVAQEWCKEHTFIFRFLECGYLESNFVFVGVVIFTKAGHKTLDLLSGYVIYHWDHWSPQSCGANIKAVKWGFKRICLAITVLKPWDFLTPTQRLIWNLLWFILIFSFKPFTGNIINQSQVILSAMEVQVLVLFGVSWWDIMKWTKLVKNSQV